MHSEEVLVTTDVTFPAFTRDPGILTMATTDPGLQRVGEGIYQYCVELEFMDSTQEKIDHILTNPRTGLQQTLTQLGHLSVSANSSAASNNQEGQLSAAYPTELFTPSREPTYDTVRNSRCRWESRSPIMPSSTLTPVVPRDANEVMCLRL